MQTNTILYSIIFLDQKDVEKEEEDKIKHMWDGRLERFERCNGQCRLMKWMRRGSYQQ